MSKPWEQDWSTESSDGGAKPWERDFKSSDPPAAERSAGGVAVDVIKSLGGSAVSAVGAIPKAVGRAVQEGGEKAFGLTMDEAQRLAEAEGTPEKALEWHERANRVNPLSVIGRGVEWVGDKVMGAGDAIRDSRSEEAKRAAELSTPSGDITKPSTWAMGEDPSIEGLTHVGADVVGSMSPVVASAVATRGRSAGTQMATGAAAVGAQVGGAAIDEARDFLGSMDDKTLFEASPVYRELLENNHSPQAAREILTRRAENTAAAYAAPVGAVGGKATAALLGKPGEKLAGMVPGITGKALVLGVLGATEEGFQEVAEGVATRAGINDAAGTDRSLTEGTFAEAVLGAKGGGVVGAGRGAITGAMERFNGQDTAPAGQGPQGGQTPPAAGETQAPAGGNAATGQRDPNAGRPAAPAQAAGVATDSADAAEAALLEPVQLTALDRANELDAERSRIAERLAELTPENGYGEMFDTERADLQEQAQAAQAERDAIAKTWPTAIQGAPTSFSTEAGARLDGEYALIDADDLVTSHDENLRPNNLFPAELQPRDRSRQASEMQVSGIVQRLDPARLGVSADAATGAPIVGADGLVESGNARTIALKRVYQAKGQKAEDYKAWLRQSAAQFGITPESVDGMRKPVLVRVRKTPVNRAEFARQANQATVQRMSSSEQAKSDASRLTSLEGLEADEQGDFSTSRDFIRQFMATLPITEQSEMIESDGRLSTSGYRRIQNAVLAKAYGDSPTLRRMTESLDNNLLNIGKALVRAAPTIAQARDRMQAGVLNDADITPDLLAAVEGLSAIKEKGWTVEQELGQGDLTGSKYSPEAMELLQFLADNIRSPRRIAEFLQAYHEALEAAGDPNQGSLLGDTEAPTRADLLKQAKGATDGRQSPEVPRADPEAGRSDGKEPQDEKGGESRPEGDAGKKADAKAGQQGNQGSETSEWVMFPASSGTLGIPRAQMPQVKVTERPALIAFLKSRGIDYERAEVKAADLKPTQAEFSPKKVEGWITSDTQGDRSVLVSADGYVLDGHHQWMGSVAGNEPAKVLRFDAPIQELLAVVRAFPGVKQSPGASDDLASQRAEAVRDFKDAMGDLAAIASKHTRAAMVPENTPDLMPTLVKLFDSAIKLVGTDIKRTTAWVKDQLKNDPRFKTFWNKISPDLYRKAALQALENPSKPDQASLFDDPADAGDALQSDLFGAAMELAEPVVKVAKIDGRAYEPARDNFVPPDVATFMPAEALAAVEKVIADNPPPRGKASPAVSTADRARAKELLAPVLNKAGDVKAEFDQKVIDIAKSVKALGQQLAPLKGMERTIVKLVEEKFQVSELKDLLRSTIVVGSYADAQAVMDAIESEFKLLRAPKNRTGDTPLRAQGKDVPPEDPAKYAGYSDIMANVVLPNGIIAEIQINVPAMVAAKHAHGHDLYDASRAMPKGSDRAAAINAASVAFYNAARDAAKKSASDSADQRAGQREAGRSPSQGDFSSSENTLPSGNSTNINSTPSPSDKSMPKRQPSGKDLGTSIGEPPSKSVPPEAVNGYKGDRPNTRDAFTLERLNRETRRMEPVTFERGEYVRYTLSGKETFGEIDGISQSRREFSVGGLWYPMGFAYKAERPAAPVRKDLAPMSKVIEKVNAKSGEGLTEADRVPDQKPASKTPLLDAHTATIAAVRNGDATVEQFKAAFAAMADNPDAVKAELNTRKKDALLVAGGYSFHQRYRTDSKAEIVEAMYDRLLDEYSFGDTYGPSSYVLSAGGMAKHKAAKLQALRDLVNGRDEAALAQAAAEVAAARAEAKARKDATQAALENPTTLAEFRQVLRHHISEGKTFLEARLMLTPEQRARYDDLDAESTREAREARKRALKTEVRAAGQTTGGQVIETKHTRDGYDLFVVQLADRLSKEDYSTILASAKRLGGWYSSFRGSGAVPGFQFKERAKADAFLKLAAGDTTDAKAQAEERRDAFEDDRGQTAVERLRAMADKLADDAAEIEGRDRKTNTTRRARFASSALAGAAAMKAKAQTMRNIAKAIEDGKAKFLDDLRTKSQIDMLTGIVETAKYSELRAKYPTYAEQEKRRGEPPTAETADFADFPSFSAFRSDLATLARQMIDVDGTKKLGQQLLKVADDVTDAYLEFAKQPANLLRLSTFSIRRGDEVKSAIFPTRELAERAIKRSGLVGKAIVLPEKRGVNRIIMSPSEAINAGIWTGDGDKRITLSVEFGNELVQAIGRRGNKSNGLTVPWQFQTAHDRRKALARIGIETASEFRSALREFISMKEQAVANKVRDMELAMVGRKKDGLDFFPTPAEVADQMVEAADLSPDMAVLEPSAGMGHLADRIRAAGAEPDVIELSPDRRELLEEKGYHLAEVDDFMAMQPRTFFTYGDLFRAPDGREGIMRGVGHMGSQRVRLEDEQGNRLGLYDRHELKGIGHRGSWSGYDRIIMNPPFSDRRDAEHVRHAYDLLKPGGRIVAIMGEGVFFGSDKKAQDFRDWLSEVGGTEEKLPAGSFMDPSLPVNTGVNARMVVIDKPSDTRLSLRQQPEDAGEIAGDVGLSFDTLQDLAQRLKARMPNMPAVNVLADPSKAPRSLREYIIRQDAWYDVEGAMHDGELYLFASGLASAERAEHVLLEHEAGHYGLRAVLGPSLKTAMRLIHAQNASVRRAATELQKRGKLSDIAATEEVIVDIPTAELAKLKGWRQVVAKARDWLADRGYTTLAQNLTDWLDGTLTQQQRADLFVAELVRAARDHVAGKTPARAAVGMGTALSGTLAEDIAKQEAWLQREAKARGFKDIEDLLERDYATFEKLAELWRKKNPADTLLSRAAPPTGPKKTAAERADDIIQKPAGGFAPLDRIARLATKVTGAERLTGAIYNKAGDLLDRLVPEKVKAGIMSDYGVPEAVIDQRIMLQGRQRVQLRKVGTLVEKLATLTREESRVAYEWMNMDGADPKAYLSKMQGLPEESVEVLLEVQKMVDDLSKEAVRMGQLTKDAFERNRFAYLRRSYAKHILEQTTGEKAKRARVISILGDQYKGRGLVQAEPMSRMQAAAPDWWGRKLASGKADTALKGQKFVRLEKRTLPGQASKPLPGMDPAAPGRVQHVVYWPADQKITGEFTGWTKADTWEVRDIKGGNVVLWRDFTKAEREQMGEVDEARFAIAKTLHGMVHDVEVGRYLEWLARKYSRAEGQTIPGTVVEASERFRDTFAPSEWVKVPDTTIPGTSVKKYGALAGHYLPGPIWNDLRQVVGGQFRPFGDTYATILRMWKTSKTALSPAVHMNNVMSNMVMADWQDVTAAHVGKALRIVLASSNKAGGITDREAAAEIVNRYKDSGGDIGSWATQEIARDQLDPLLAELDLEMAATNGQALDAQAGIFAALQHALGARFPAAWEALKAGKTGKAARGAGGALIDLYQAEDDVFRLAAWLKSKEEGADDLAAGKKARRSFLDYNINAPWIQAMRQSAWPFISFTYRAVPLLAEIAGKKPHKLMKLMMFAGGLNALGALLAGGDDDDERKMLPEEKAGSVWGIVPKLIRMPWNDEHGSPVYLDIRRWVPVGDVFDVGQGNAAVPMLPGLMPGGPLVLAGEVVLNKSAFTGKPITLETDTGAEKAEKLGGYLYKAFAPNIIGLPGTYATENVVGSMTGRTDAFGRELSTTQAVASSFGVKLGSYPGDVLRRNLAAKAQFELSEIDRQLSQLKRQYSTGRVDMEDLREQAADLNAKKVKIAEELREKLN